MDRAIVRNIVTGETTSMTAHQYERQIRGNKRLDLPGNPEIEQNLELIDPDDAIPLHFRGSHSRMGDEERVRACFVRIAGFGNQDHIFDRDGDTFEQALDKGKKVILSLNNDLSYRRVDYRKMRSRDTDKLEYWLKKNKGRYISVSVKSAQDVTESIKKIAAIVGKEHVSDRVFALHRGGVMPYSSFYLGANRQKLSDLHDSLQSAFEGVRIGESRMLGFPRLFRFVAADTTKKHEASRGFRSTPIWREQSRTRLFNQLVFSDESENDAQAVREKWQRIADADGEIYVLASPSITTGKNGQNGVWRQLRWIVNDFDAQTNPVNRPAPAIAAE